MLNPDGHAGSLAIAAGLPVIVLVPRRHDPHFAWRLAADLIASRARSAALQAGEPAPIVRQRQPFSLGSLVAVAVLVTGIAAALNPTKAHEVWHAFAQTLAAVAWACVSIFL